MNAKQVLSKCLSLVTPMMHKTRRLSLFTAIESSMNGGSISVTGLGRDIDSKAMEKHKIKRVVVKLNWPRFYSLASTFSLTRLVLNRHYVDAA